MLELLCWEDQLQPPCVRCFLNGASSRFSERGTDADAGTNMGATAQCLVRRSSQGIELVSVADSGRGESVVVVLQGTIIGVQV